MKPLWERPGEGVLDGALHEDHLRERGVACGGGGGAAESIKSV